MRADRVQLEAPKLLASTTWQPGGRAVQGKLVKCHVMANISFTTHVILPAITFGSSVKSAATIDVMSSFPKPLSLACHIASSVIHTLDRLLLLQSR